MDLLSHALVGGLVAAGGLQQKYGLVATATVVAASVAPDLDGLPGVFDARYFLELHRHPLTHSIGGAALLSAGITVVVTAVTPWKSPLPVFVVAFSGALLHVLSDLLTSWPIELFWPLSTRSFSLDLIPFLDPVILVWLLGGYLVTLRWPQHAGIAVLIAALGLAAFVGYRAGLRAVALGVADPTVAQRAALPHGLTPFQWDVIDGADGDYTVRTVDARRGIVEVERVFRSEGDERAIAASRGSPLVQAFLRRARFPFAVAAGDGSGTTVDWGDAQILATGGGIRGIRVLVGPDGSLSEAKIRFGLTRDQE